MKTLLKIFLITNFIFFVNIESIFSQENKLPIRYCPIQLEFELVGLASDAVQGVDSTTGHTSESFLIDNVHLKFGLFQPDNSLDNEYAQHLIRKRTTNQFQHFYLFVWSPTVVSVLAEYY
jgi:hypothetical protein